MAKDLKNIKLIVWIDGKLEKELKSAADENDLSKSETIRQALQAGLEKFFTDSQGEFLKEKIGEVIDSAVKNNMDKLREALEKRLIALLVQNTNYTLQTYSLTDKLLRLSLGFNHEKIKSLSDEKLLNLIKANIEIFEDEAKGFMNRVYEKSRRKADKPDGE